MLGTRPGWRRRERLDVRSQDHHGDLVTATALALWSAVGRPRGTIEVVLIENWF